MAGPGLYLDPDDVPGSIRTKLTAMTPGSVELMVPYGLAALRSPVGMRLLAQELRRQGFSATLRTSDGDIAARARSEGLAVRGIDRSAPVASQPDVVRSAAAYTAYRTAVAERIAAQRRGVARGVALLITFAAAAAVFGVMVLPSAVITIAPATQEARALLTVKASTLAAEPDVQGLVLPARSLSTEVRVGLSESFATTQKAPDAKAVGRVTFTNTTPNAVEIPPRSRISTPEGVTFETNSRVTVPSQGALDVAVTAVEGGEEGNVAAGTVTQTRENNLQGKVSVTNAAAFTRGTSVDRVVIRDQDVVELRRRASEQALADGVRQVRQSLPADLSFYDQAARLVVSQEMLDRLAGVGSAELRINLQGTVSVVAFWGREMNQLVARHIMAGADGRDADGAGPSIRILGLASADPDAITFHVDTTAGFRARVNPEQVKAAARGRSIAEAQAALAERFELAAAPRVQTWPFWVSQVPNWSWRLDVRSRPLGS